MRRLGITLMTTAALLFAGAVTAFACTNLATLNLSESNSAAGATIDVSGSSFSTDSDATEVAIHWDGVDGPELASVEPDTSGAIATEVEIPSDAEPGYHVLVATQMTEAEGGHESEGLSPAFGTPARASILVGEEVPQPQATAEPSTGAAPAAETSSGLLAVFGLLAVAGVGLFGAGLGLFVREVRQRRSAPAPARRE